MNKTLHALINMLEWQRRDITHKLVSITQKISNPSAIQLVIQPEQEIARHHFMVHQLQRQTDLKTQQIHLNRKLKLMEKHQATTLKRIAHNALVTQQNTLDEWIVQRREPL